MGGTSSSTSTTTQGTTPYGAAAAPLNGILGNVGAIDPKLSPTEVNALATMSANAGTGASPFAPAISGAANSLLSGGGAADQSGMINDAYAQYQKALSPYATGGMSGLDSPQMNAVLDKIRNDASMGVNGLFAANGRDASGYNQQTLARGIAEGEAVPLLNQMNQDTQNRLGAAGSLFGAGTTAGGLLSQFNQNANTNKLAGITASDAALTAQNYGPMQQLAIEAQRRGIPLSTMAQQMGLVMPAAQAFGTTTGNTQGTQTMSGAEQFGTIAKGAAAAASTAAMIF